MDIQLYATDEVLEEFPEDENDSDKISDPNNIYLSISDLPRPLTDLPRPPASLPTSTAKVRCRYKAKRSHNHKTKSIGKNPIVTHSVIQLNECLSPIQEKGSLIQMSASAYLMDQSFNWSLVQPMVVWPILSQLAVGQLGAGLPSVDQLCVPILQLLSLWLQPDLKHLPRPSLPKLFTMCTSESRLAECYQNK